MKPLIPSSVRLMHYSDRSLDEVRSVEQRDPDWHGDKPTGLWVSVEGPDDWKSWCESEGFFVPRLAISHVVQLSEAANILHLDSHSAIDDLTRKYGAHIERLGFLASCGIDWRRVSRDYQGIVIAPYQWSQRLDTPWYYGWDCASGCIWDREAIAGLDRLAAAEDTAPSTPMKDLVP